MNFALFNDARIIPGSPAPCGSPGRLLPFFHTCLRWLKAMGAIGCLIVCLTSLLMLLMDRGEFDYVWFSSAISQSHTAWLGSASVWSHRLLLELDHARYEGTDANQIRPRAQAHIASQPGLVAESWNMRFDRDPSGITWLGFKYFHRTTRTLATSDVVETRQVRGVAIPFGWIAAGSAAPGPMWIAGLARRRSRRRRGACIGCGYDLRASSGCCPECGSAIPIPNSQP